MQTGSISWQTDKESEENNLEKEGANRLSDNVIEVEGIGKCFNGIWVLRDVNFDLRRGEIHALVGENGAGKSTFIKMLSGAYGTDAGVIRFDGKEVTFSNVKKSEEMGIRTVHQEINLVPYFTVYQNVFIGSELTQKGRFVTDDRGMRKRAQAAMDLLGIDCNVNRVVGNMNATMQKIIQICSVLVYDPRVIIFDEPTAALGESEREKLLEIIVNLKNKGMSIIYISHNLEEIEAIADRVTVFRNGSKVALLEREEIDMDKIVSLMLGDKSYTSYQRNKSYATDQVMLEMRHVTTDKLQDVSFQIHRGEIVGVAGVVGTGKTEIAEAIFGLDKLKSGEILMNGKKYASNPRAAIANRIALVPEERRVQGLIPDFPVARNVTLSYMNKWVKNLVIRKDKETETAEEYIEKLSIKTQGPKQMIKYLSGGNQQKVILSRWLVGDFELGIFDDPTKGIDIGAKEDIYVLMDQLAQQGKSILMTSSYLPELLFNCDRILVMRGGKLVGEFEMHGQDVEAEITKLMLGGNKHE